MAMTPHILLALLFVLTVAHLLTLKICAEKIDHRTAPVFVSFWTLLGLAVTAPVFGHLWTEGWEKMATPQYLSLAVVRGLGLYAVFVISQELMQTSLSSRHYVTPMAVGMIAVVNFFLGEQLTPLQWLSALSLCALAAAFFFKGHMADLNVPARRSYLKLVGLTVFLASVDYTLAKNTNWYALLLVSNIVLLAVSLFINRARTSVLRQAFVHKSAILAGAVYVVAEMVKYYQMVAINPVSVIVTVQAATKPVVLALAALLWKERTVKEQLLWGTAAFLVTLPLFFK